MSRLGRIALAVATGLAIGLMCSQLRAAWTQVQASDFRVFYESGRSWLTGADLYATTSRLPNLNPPHFIVAFAPLSWLPVEQALAVWLIINVACGIAAVAIILRALELPRSAVTAQVALAAAGLCTGVLVALEEAQITGVLMLMMTMAWSASRRGSWTLCGIILGLLVSVKPFLACLLLIPLRRGQFAALACAALAAAAAVATGVAFAGPSSLQRWVETGRLVTWFHHPANASLLGLLARAGTTSWIVWLGLSGAALIISAAFVGPSRMLDHEWAAFALLSLLISPLGWNYYLPVVAGPIVAVARTNRSVAYASFGFVWPIPLLAAVAPVTWWSAVSVGSLQTWSLIALWATVLRAREVMSPASAAQRAYYVSQSWLLRGPARAHRPGVLSPRPPAI